MFFKTLWLGNSSNTNFHFLVVGFLRLNCYLPNFRWSLLSLVTGQLLTYWSLTYCLIDCWTPFLPDFLPLSAYMDDGWGPTTPIRPFVFRN